MMNWIDGLWQSPFVHFIKVQFYQPYFVFLLAWLPILSLYLHNLSELTISALIVPMATVTIVGCVYLGIGWVLLKDWTKAGLLAAAAMWLLVNYGDMVGWYKFHQIPIVGLLLTANKVLFPLLILILLAFAYWLWATHLRLEKVTAILNILFLALIVQLVWQVGVSQYNRSLNDHPLSTYVTQPKIVNTTSSLGYNPDVYYVIFDRYANQHTLQDDYNFDNSGFLNSLKSQGFYVADQAAANYPYTPLSISSSLDMTYLEKVAAGTHPYPTLATDIYPLLQQTNTSATFQALGYKFYQMGSWFPPTHSNDNADGNYVQENVLGVDNFMTTFLTKTMAAPVLQHVLPDSLGIQFEEQHASNFAYQQAHFSQVVNLAGPKFVFVHMLMPHPPYIVDADCQPLQGDVQDHRTELQNYLQQVQCANKQALSMVQTIMKASDKKAIIIFQSDEGPYTIRYKMKDSVEFQNASDGSILERSRILNAYYFPDGDTSQLYRSISPVNSFRTVFRQYFGMSYNNLEDKTYVPPSRPHLMDFMDVTNVLEQSRQ